MHTTAYNYRDFNIRHFFRGLLDDDLLSQLETSVTEMISPSSEIHSPRHSQKRPVRAVTRADEKVPGGPPLYCDVDALDSGSDKIVPKLADS